MNWIDKWEEEIIQSINDKKKLRNIIKEIYDMGFEDGIEESDEYYEPEPIPWEDLD